MFTYVLKSAYEIVGFLFTWIVENKKHLSHETIFIQYLYPSSLIFFFWWGEEEKWPCYPYSTLLQQITPTKHILFT